MESIEKLGERLEAMEYRAHMIEKRLRWWRILACGLLVLGPGHSAVRRRNGTRTIMVVPTRLSLPEQTCGSSMAWGAAHRF